MLITNSDMPHMPSVFLAGPTPRNDKRQTWRPEAIKLFEEYKFKGNLLVPERADWSIQFDYMNQVEWELEGMERADLVLFWVPSNADEMLALTTRTEFGYCVGSGKPMAYGRPDGAFKTDYLDALYMKRKKSPHIFNDLKDLVFYITCLDLKPRVRLT